MNQADLVSAFARTGLKAGDVVLVHSAMRTLGPLEGGADAVVAALLEVVGPAGTVVAPTFTFRHETAAEPLIDPAQDRSEMGAISEAVRRWPGARRSLAFRHSFAAVGRRAQAITEIDPRLSPFDVRGAFGVMLALDARILLLGVTYSSCTSVHFCEWLCDVPYRETRPVRARVRQPDGRIGAVVFTDYRPKPAPDGSYYGKRTADFNRLGGLLEGQGKVTVAAVGNAVARRMALRDLCALAETEAARDPNIFRSPETETGRISPLRDGKIVVVGLTDGAGRSNAQQWAVVDPARLEPPAGIVPSRIL